MLSTMVFVFLSNYITATISPILVPIIIEFDNSVAKAGYLITTNILCLGLGVSLYPWYDKSVPDC